MIDRNYSPDLPPRGVRVAIWFVLGILLLAGFNSFERFVLPDAADKDVFVGVGTAAAVYLWGTDLNVLLELTDVDMRHAVRMTGRSMVVAFAGFAVGAVVYLAIKAAAPALLAGFGTVIPFCASVTVLLAGLLLTTRAYERRR